MTGKKWAVLNCLNCVLIALMFAAAPGYGLESAETPAFAGKPAEFEKIIEHVSPETNTRTSVFRRAGDAPIVYFSGMTIDADGAPNAYHPNDASGIDALEHAGANGDWWALALDERQAPVVQRKGEFTGFYVSKTWLSRQDELFSETDPEYWLDSRKVRYIAVPETVWTAAGVEKGDLAYVFDLETGKSSFAIVGDWGTENTLGEGSIALARALGIDADPRTGGQDSGMAYLVFPHSASHPRWPRNPDDMKRQAEKLMQEWGGRDAVMTLQSIAFRQTRK